MSTPDLPRLLGLISGMRFEDLTVYSDVTLTILRQSDDGSGFPERMRQLIRELLVRGVAFVFVSGDSRAILKTQLTDRLDLGSDRVYVASGSGADIFVDEPHQGGRRHRTLFQLPPLRSEVLTAVFDQGLAVLQSVLGHPLSLSLEERARLLSPEGDRIDVADRIPGLNEEVLLECRPTKGFTLFLPQRERATGLGLRLLQSLGEDAALQEICAGAALIPCLGPNFYDATLSDKHRAIELFRQTPEGRRLAARRAVAVGDSTNDAPLMRFFANTDAIRVFVGAADEFESVTGSGPNAVFLGGNLEGTMLLFEELLRV